MSAERWRRVQELFEQARGLSPAERAELLERECGNDGELRSEIESLLAAADRPGAADSLGGWLAPLRRRIFGDEETPPAVGPYEVAAELGRGGMGVVYRARDPRLGREVAVKVLHGDLAADEEMASRFVAEARAASALDHPHVCTVHDLGRLDDGRLFLAMAFYPGGSLADRLAGAPLPVDEAVRIAGQLASGLHRAHEAGIVHRDVKPANVAFSADGDAKLLDFGVAKLAAAAGVTLPGTVLGTPRYMAPEQLRGEEVDRRTDVWALSAVVYEMLAGRPAFGDEEAAALRRRILSGEPDSLERLRPEVPAAVREAVARGLRKEPAERPATAADFSALLSGEARASGTAPAPSLPVPPTSFVGREREVEELAGLLGRARLVTLTGPGGTGKTRLAVETARRLAEAGTEVHLVALADLRDARLVPPTVARALGVEVGGARDPLDGIAAAIGTSRRLVILDNLEQLTEAAPWLAELLAHCPGIALLATSRGPLRLTVEQEYPVPPLPSAPGDSGRGAEGDLAGAPPAIRLFCDRALAAVPDLELEAGDREAVVEICRRLDGLPLALELAAARVRLFPPRQLLEQLRERIDLPGAAPRDHPDRHRSLRAALAWSYELLDPADRRLFRALSVFRGGFTLGQAAHLTGLETPELADGLDALLDQALLVRPVTAGGGEPRFGLLETLHVFAGEELESEDEAEAVRAAHRRLFLELAEEAAPHLAAGDQQEWFERLDRDHDNLRAALDGAAAAGEVEAGLRLATALWRYWLTRGHVVEGLERFERLLDGDAGGEPELRLRALLGAATLAHNAGRNRRARTLLDEANELVRRLGDDRARLQVLNNLAWVACEMSDLAVAETLGGEALELARALGDRRGEAVALNNLGFLAAHREEWEEASRHHRESLALRRSIGDLRGEGFALINLSWAEREAGRLAEAADHLAAALERVRPLGDRIFLAWARVHEAALLDARGETERAFDLLDEATAGWRDTGNLSQIGEAQTLRGRLARRLGKLELARTLLEEAIRCWQSCGTRLSEAAAARELAEVAHAERRPEEARRWWRESLRLAEEVGAPAAAELARGALEWAEPTG